jgi:peptide/nickel transport system permease protein
MIRSSKQIASEKEIILSPTRIMINKFASSKLAMLGFLTFVAIVTLVVAFTLWIELTDYNLADTSRIETTSYAPPSFENFFGTDRFGRDYFVRVMAGGWISIQVGLLATLLSVFIGVAVGSTSGFFGGKIDNALMRFTEVIQALPFLPIAILVSVAFIDSPETEKLFLIIFILGCLNWTGLARLVRGQILSLREQEFMIAARALGIKSHNQIFRHLIPNVIAYVIVSATITFASSILAEATLSYLGLSVSEPVPTWGGLLQRASNSIIMRNQWWMWVYPGILLFSFIMSVNLIGDGLRDAVDPKYDPVITKKVGIVKRLIRAMASSIKGGR